MLAQQRNPTMIDIPAALKLAGMLGGILATLVVLTATLAYIPNNPDFSPFRTYLSDIGDTPGWPQIVFHAGTLVAAPVRFLVLVLVALRLSQYGARRNFVAAALIIGFLATFGTILMTAVPFSVGPAVHKLGIVFYFLGVVFLQAVVFVQEWSLKGIPKILPSLSLLLVVLYLAFFALVQLYMGGVVSRTAPVIWEWMCIIASIVWVFVQSIVLGTSTGQGPLQS